MSASKTTVRINNQIRVPEVRLVGADGEQVGVISTREALNIAAESSLDLVEVSPNAKPPVCKVMDYGKFKFQQSKKTAAAKKKQKQIQVKEIKFRPGTEDGDFNVKLKKILAFLEKGNKVKVTIRFRGREMMHQNLGMELMKRLQEQVEEHAAIEVVPKMEGRQMVMILAPKAAK